MSVATHIHSRIVLDRSGTGFLCARQGMLVRMRMESAVTMQKLRSKDKEEQVSADCAVTAARGIADRQVDGPRTRSLWSSSPRKLTKKLW